MSDFKIPDIPACTISVHINLRDNKFHIVESVTSF
jgi:hypothetical protein